MLLQWFLEIINSILVSPQKVGFYNGVGTPVVELIITVSRWIMYAWLWCFHVVSWPGMPHVHVECILCLLHGFAMYFTVRSFILLRKTRWSPNAHISSNKCLEFSVRLSDDFSTLSSFHFISLWVALTSCSQIIATFLWHWMVLYMLMCC